MFDLIILLSLLLIGYGFGTYNERRHFRSIQRREEELQDILAFSTRRLPAGSSADVCLVAGNVVISIDYFKKVSAGLRNIIGGRVSAYESLLERARREAILRMKAAAREQGANAIFNVRLETSSITKGSRGQIGAVEVLAYGTGLTTR
ncbi:MAG: YbjQ family protein [Gammaproteobacteria bacterium]|nr:YbjQ family protein [Gammaproteobacteria bacterium]